MFYKNMKFFNKFLQDHDRVNYHITHKQNREFYLCGCFRVIRLTNGKYLIPSQFFKKNKHKLEPKNAK